jgi:hypothetical protein
MVNFASRAVRACRTAWGYGVAREERSGGMTHEAPEMFAAPGMFWLALVVAVQAVTSVACVEVNGGAVELSWSVRTFDGIPLKDACDDDKRKVHLETIRLAWKAVADAGDAAGMEPDGWTDFPCADLRGITEFTVPRGEHLLWVVPICRDNGPATGNYQVPPPIVRTIREGTVTTLDALLVVVDESTCPAAAR